MLEDSVPKKVIENYEHVLLPEFKEFLNDKNFWDNIHDDLEIPLDYFLKKDPMNQVAGHRIEKAMLDIAGKDALQQMIEVDRAKGELKKEGLDEASIADMLKDDFPNISSVTFIGKFGSAKTLLFNKYKDKFYRMRELYKFKGYDYVIRRDNKGPYRVNFDEVSAGVGLRIEKDYDSKEELKRAAYVSSLAAGILGTAVTSGAFLEWTFKINAELIRYGFINWFELLGYSVYSGMPMFQFLEFALLGIPILHYVKKWVNKRESKRPRTIIKGIDAQGKARELSIDTDIDVDKLRGLYSDMESLPFQECVTEPKLLYGNGNVTIIEKLGDLNKDSQQLLAQVYNEKVFNILGNSEFKKLYFTLPLISLNPDDQPSVEDSFRNRMNFGLVKYVKNEIRDRKFELVNEQTSYEDDNWVKFLAKYVRGGVSNSKPFDKSALDEVVEVARRNSDDSFIPAVDRSWISMVKHAAVLAKEDKNAPYTTREHVKESERMVKSLIQSILIDRLENFNLSDKYSSVKNEPISYEKVRVLALLRDENLISELKSKYTTEGSGIFDLFRDSLEESVGYLAEVGASVQKVSNAANSKFVFTRNFEGIEEYKKTVIGMLEKERIFLDKYSIVIDNSKMFNLDETLITSAYLLIHSKIKGRPLRQDKALSLYMDMEGSVLPLQKVNKRISYSPDTAKNIVVTGYDKEMRVKDCYYPDRKLIGVSSKDELIKEMLG